MKFAAKIIFLVFLGCAATAPLQAVTPAEKARAAAAAKNNPAHKEPGTRVVRCSYQARMGSNVKQKVCKDIHSSGDVASRDTLAKMKRCKGAGCSGRNL